MTDSERQKIWDEFLTLWPREKIENMTLPQYISLGNRQCFTHWLEHDTRALGSIVGGGTALKFGIYCPTDPGDQHSDRKVTFGSGYAWRTSLGSSPTEVFEKVRSEILRIIDTIRKGDMAAIESKILASFVARKIAYLYQDREHPLIVGVFHEKKLKSFLGIPGTDEMDMAELYRRVMAKRGNTDLITYSREIWEKGEQGGTPAEASSLPSPLAYEHTPIPLNQILYGPPGTGKTYHTVDRALDIFRAAGLDTGTGREEQLACYEKLREWRHIRFVTFHQSFSYEDFVEGIRANVEDGAIRYDVKSGIFREICEDARRQVQHQIRGKFDPVGRTVWKMSLGNTQKDEDSGIYQYCKTNNCLLMGYGGDLDFSSCGDWRAIQDKFRQELPEQIMGSERAVGQLNNFVLQMQPGDLVVISEGNYKFRAVGVVGGNYRVIDNGHDTGGYRQCRDVEWLYFCDPAQDVKTIYDRNFSQITLYRLDPAKLKWPALSALLDSSQEEDSLPYVLIIDEINRGNIAAIFGELITLVEPSHRADGAEPLTLTLPYSRDTFSIPGNVYLIGTMNTADRSLTQLDAALRRRFAMIYEPPCPELLSDVIIPSTGVSLGDILKRMNERITVLLDSDHCIGHAPFMELRKAASGTELLGGLRDVFLGYIIPLLEEYFFDDREKISMILNDQAKPEKARMFKKQDLVKIFGNAALPEDRASLWELNRDAFANPLSYASIFTVDIGPQASESTEAAAESASQS